MREKQTILGSYISGPYLDHDSSPIEEAEASVAGALFSSYIWGEHGIDSRLNVLFNKSYGNDIDLILLQFYLRPIPYLLEHLKEIESYRKKEKAIGLPIIVNDENFFNRTESERSEFLKRAILQKLDLLAEVVRKKKLDTNIELLKADVEKVLG